MIKHTTELCPWKIPHASRIFSRLLVFSPQNHRFSGQENLRKLFDIFAKDTILLEKTNIKCYLLFAQLIPVTYGRKLADKAVMEFSAGNSERK